MKSAIRTRAHTSRNFMYRNVLKTYKHMVELIRIHVDRYFCQVRKHFHRKEIKKGNKSNMQVPY